MREEAMKRELSRPEWLSERVSYYYLLCCGVSVS